MKRLFITMLLFSGAFSAVRCQTLITGVYSSITMASNHFKPIFFFPSCYDYWYTFDDNVNVAGAVPHGMTLYLRIDSFSHPGDSVKLWRSSDMPGYHVAHAGDTFRTKPLVTGSSDIYAYFFDTGTVYTSVIMAGTPDSAGQPYFCTYAANTQIVIDDPCTDAFCDIYAGSGPLDTVQGCTVLSGLALGMGSLSRTGAELFPNPVQKYLNISSPEVIHEVCIMDVPGNKLLAAVGDNRKMQIDVSSLSVGLYYVRINGTEVRKFIKE